MSDRGPWRQDHTSAGVAYGPPGAPPGAPYQVAPIGAPPASAGDPALLPRNTTTNPLDVSSLFSLAAGSIMAFLLPMTEGSLAARAKHVECFTWTWDIAGVATFTADQYVIQVVTIPAGVDPGRALQTNQFFINDHGLSGTRPVVKGGYQPPIYVPPNFTAVVFSSNPSPALDPAAGRNQRVYAQWRLV